MQTDLQALLIITAIVCGIYIVANLLRKRNKTQIFDESENLENDEDSNIKSQSDPLMEEAESLAFDKNVSRAKKVIVDDSVTKMAMDYEDSNDFQTSTPFEEEVTYVALTVMAKKDQPFIGSQLFHAFKANHLYFGKDKIFHRHINDNSMHNGLYSVLSLVNPGTFDADTMAFDVYPGIVLLMQLSNRSNHLMVFEKMLTTARQLAVSLGGELCDASRKPLTAQVMSQIREKIQKSHRRILTQSPMGA